MNKDIYYTLYEFLGRAAGDELGLRVSIKAKEVGIKLGSKYIDHKGYKGEVRTYPKDFLEKYFNEEKMENKMKKHVVLSLSGGMDSSTLLLRCLKEFDSVTAISFDYGQKHRVELERAQSLVNYLNDNPDRIHQDSRYNNGEPVEKYPKINYQVIKLDGLSSLLNSTLVEGGDEVPEGHYEEANMVKSVVENRNKIFSSIIQAVALSISNRTEENCDIALGIHAGDHQIYLDCRSEFRDADLHAFKVGNWNSERVNYYTPYLEGDKITILKDGQKLCNILGLDFNEVYKRTNTSYKPYPSGNSDYKSASSVERILAFVEVGLKDPVQYEDESGLVDWEIAKKHALKVEEDFKSMT